MFVERLTPERLFASIPREQMYVAHTHREHLRRWDLVEALVRRVRWPLLALGAVALLGAGFATEAVGSPLLAGPVPAAAERVTVEPGDSLWTIASRRYPDADARQKVFEIEQLNGLRTPTIVPGQRLRVPAR